MFVTEPADSLPVRAVGGEHGGSGRGEVMLPVKASPPGRRREAAKSAAQLARWAWKKGRTKDELPGRESPLGAPSDRWKLGGGLCPDPSWLKG